MSKPIAKPLERTLYEVTGFIALIFVLRDLPNAAAWLLLRDLHGSTASMPVGWPLICVLSALPLFLMGGLAALLFHRARRVGAEDPAAGALAARADELKAWSLCLVGIVLVGFALDQLPGLVENMLRFLDDPSGIDGFFKFSRHSLIAVVGGLLQLLFGLILILKYRSVLRLIVPRERPPKTPEA